MFNFVTRRREQTELDELMRAMGFAVAVPPDPSTRPIRPAWYQGLVYGRPVAITLTGRRMHLTGGGDGGNAHGVQIVASIHLGAVGVAPLGYGLHTSFGELPDPDPARLIGPGHPAAAMPGAVRAAFHRFARGRAAPHETGRSPLALHVRITDRSKLQDYLPQLILPTTAVLVMHDLPMRPGWQAQFVPNTNELGRIAHALEVHAGARAER